MLLPVPPPRPGPSAQPCPGGCRWPEALGTHQGTEPVAAGRGIPAAPPRAGGTGERLSAHKARSKLVQPVAASAEGQLGTGGVEVMCSLLPQLGKKNKKTNPKNQVVS